MDDYTSANPSTPATFTRYAYDPVTGKQASVTTPEGTVNYRYDQATGELLETWTGTAGTSSAGTDVLYGYDSQGRLASVTQVRLDGAAVASGASTVRYDADGHSITTTQPTTLYAYDAVGNLQSVSEPNGQTTTYQYDDLNRLTLETVKQGATLVETFDYDQVLVTGTKNAGLMLKPDGDRGGEVDTRYASNGTTVTSQMTTAWTYDADDRLRGEALTVQVGEGQVGVPSAYTDTFVYDLANNRTEEDINGGDATAGGMSIRYVYGVDDQLQTETEKVYATATTTTQVYQTSYTYDDAGNLWTEVKSATAGGTTTTTDSTYTYDLRDRMARAMINAVETDYGYDTDGVRVSEGGPTGTQTYYLNDPANPTGYTKAIEEKTGTSPSSATVSRSYVFGVKVEAQSDTTNGTLYLMTDGHSSTRALIDGTGLTIETYTYDAYGTLLAGTHTNPTTHVTTAITAGATATDWLFGGDGLYDPASGWTYHLARWRNGFQFTSRDFGTQGSGRKSDPGTLHRYTYSNNNPVSMDDRSGHEGELVGTLAAVGIRGILSGLELTGFTAVADSVRGIEAGISTDQIFGEFALQQATAVVAMFGLSKLGSLWGALRDGSLFAAEEVGVVSSASSEVEVISASRGILSPSSSEPTTEAALLNELRSSNSAIGSEAAGLIASGKVEVELVPDAAGLSRAMEEEQIGVAYGNGDYDPEKMAAFTVGNRIYVRSDVYDAAGTVVHEVQHTLQNSSGFNRFLASKGFNGTQVEQAGNCRLFGAISISSSCRQGNKLR